MESNFKELMPMGPITRAYLENPLPKEQHHSKTGHFYKHYILEIKRHMKYRPALKDLPVYFTMRDCEHKDLVSIKQIYMNSIDEFDCAMKIFGSWDHWLYLLKDNHFLNGDGTLKGVWTGVASWREEKRMLQQHQARKLIIDMASKGNFAAAKMLFEETNVKNEVGRPSKNKLLNDMEDEVNTRVKAEQDMKRIRLAINNDKASSQK